MAPGSILEAPGLDFGDFGKDFQGSGVDFGEICGSSQRHAEIPRGECLRCYGGPFGLFYSFGFHLRPGPGAARCRRQLRINSDQPLILKTVKLTFGEV